MVTVTENAVKKFKEVIEEAGRIGEGIRIYLAPGGWGPSLAMDIAKIGVEGDTTIEQEGLNLFLDPQASGMLMNSTIDFNKMQGFGVTGTQPSSSCGTCKC